MFFCFSIDSTCVEFPGPGEKHIYTFNPMREFIHNYDHHVNEAFDEFKEKHGKTYDGHKDHLKRKELFRQNMRFNY